MPTLVDSNVILDVVQKDPEWAGWSQKNLAEAVRNGAGVNAIVFSELCVAAACAADVDALLVGMGLSVLDVPREALFRAARAHLAYRRRGGVRTMALPDFFIGAHAEVAQMQLLTRDPGRYRTYFPAVSLITPP